MIGYAPDHDYRYTEVNRLLRQWRPKVLLDVVDQLKRHAEIERNAKSDLLTINDEWTLSVVLARCKETSAGMLRWSIRFDTRLYPDLTLAVRMDQSNMRAKDYYLIPRIDLGAWTQRLGEENSRLIDSYRFESLDVLDELASRASMEVMQ